MKLEELKVNRLYRFGIDHVIKILSVKGAGLGQVIGPRGAGNSTIPLEACLDAIGEEIVPSEILAD